MKLKSISFTSPVVYNEIPELYEGLGLPDLGSHFEQRFEFVLSIGKKEHTGRGSIRFFKNTEEFKISLSDPIPGIGPRKLPKLKELLLDACREPFAKGISTYQPPTNVIFVDFTKRK